MCAQVTGGYWSAFIDAEHAKTVMFGEVGVIFQVQGGQRQVADQAARRDPGVIDRSRASPADGLCLQFTPT